MTCKEKKQYLTEQAKEILEYKGAAVDLRTRNIRFTVLREKDPEFLPFTVIIDEKLTELM